MAIRKAREPARILLRIGKRATEPGHWLYKTRGVDQYNFSIYHRAWGRTFVRIGPSFPFPAPVYLNQHYGLAQRLKEQGIRFLPCANAFLRGSDSPPLQQLADSLQPQDITPAPRNGSPPWSPSLPPASDARPVSNTVCSSPKSNTVTTSSLSAGLPWIVWESVCGMPIEPLATPIPSASSSVATSPNTLKVSCQP